MASGRSLFVFSGVIIVNFWNNHVAGWRSDTLNVLLDKDIASAIRYGSTPAPDGHETKILVEQYASLGGMNSIFDKDNAVNAGFAVDSFAPAFEIGSRLLTGIQLQLAVQDGDAALLRVAYHLTAVARFIQVKQTPVL